MLYSTLVVAASALAGFASAQSNTTFNTPIPCCSVPASSVPSDERSSWCQANVNTCVDLCGGQANIASNGNDCADATLEYTCNCVNGTNAAPALEAYEQSVPGQMCRFWYNTCVTAAGNKRDQLFECERARDARCGKLAIDDSGAISSASASSSSSSPTARSSGGSTPTGSTTPTPSTGAAANFAQYGGPILAGGLLAVFGIAL